MKSVYTGGEKVAEFESYDELRVGDSKPAFIYEGSELVYPSPVKDGLVLWYDFSGRTNTDSERGIAEDLSGNGNHGTLQNFNYTAESGYDKNKLLFDGVDDEIFTYFNGYGTEYSTYEAVLDFRRFSEQAYQSIFQRYSFWVDGLFFSGSQVRSYLSLDTGGRSSMINAPTKGLFHLVRTLDLEGGQEKIYFDGKIVSDKDDLIGKLDVRASTNNLIIGHSANALNSAVCSVKVYNRPLTPVEVAHNYTVEKERFNIE